MPHAGSLARSELVASAVAFATLGMAAAHALVDCASSSALLGASLSLALLICVGSVPFARTWRHPYRPTSVALAVVVANLLMAH